MSSNDALLINSDDKLSNCDEVCLRLDYDTSVEDATNRVFIVSHECILSDLMKLAHSFSLRWNFCTVRSGRRMKCNRTTRHGLRQIKS